MSALTIGVPIISGFIISILFRKLGKSAWISYIVPCIIVGLAFFLSAYLINEFYNEFSVFENFRIEFLCFLGVGFAEFVYSIYEAMSVEKK